jgi:hypothetical protein
MQFSEEVDVKKIVILTMMLLCTGSVFAQTANPLIGKWKLISTPGTANGLYCATPLVFSADSETINKAGLPATGHVTSEIAHTKTYATTVEVTDDSAQSQTYSFSSKDKMQSDDPAGCPYQRG